MSLVERIIVMASGTASDYRNSIAGQLYLARTAAVEGIHMPVGLPVEDGFLRAMILTRLLTEGEHFERIHGEPGSGMCTSRCGRCRRWCATRPGW
jgi:hypothetical protein